MADQPREPLEAVLRRLKEERDEADARYNEALTALDRTVRPPVELPKPAPGLDDHQISALNEAWNILPAPPQASRFQRKLTGFIWRVIGPYLQRQLTFNSLLVDHVNRNAAAQREAYRAADATVAARGDQLAALAAFQSRLMVYLQQITAYVDTKDRDTVGGALVLNASSLSGLAEDFGKRMESLAARAQRYEAREIRYHADFQALRIAHDEFAMVLKASLNASLSGMAENFAKRVESSAAREHRYEARTSALAAAHEDLRAMTGVSQQGLLSLKREVERLMTGRAGPSAPPDPRTPGLSAPPAPPTDAFSPALDAYKYVGFEDQFRGSREVIRARLESYLPFFATDGHRQERATDAHGHTRNDHGDVLDVGCGRGEFLDLLEAKGIPARGIDLNHEMAELCRARGLDVTEADAVGYLSSLPDGSLAGIFSAQVVEHLQPGYLLQFLELAYHKLRPGGRVVLETLNPACWVAFFESYIRDITHVWPLHPETLKYLVVASGFTRVQIEFRSPVPHEDRLRQVAAPEGADAGFDDLVKAFNSNVEKLNARVFTFMDYAIVAEKAAVLS